MPLIIAHGQPKSGSSFLFQIANAAAETKSGCNIRQTRERYLSGILKEDQGFATSVTDDLLAQIMDAIPADAFYVLRTHGPLLSGARRAIESGVVRAFTSFRDPRDVSVSLLDAGKTARRTGANNWFATLFDAKQTVKHCRHGHMVMREWAECPNVLAFPFYITSGDRDYLVNRMCDHIGLPETEPHVRQKFGNGGTVPIWFFEKGVADRYRVDLLPEDVDMLTRELACEIEATERLNRHWLTVHGNTQTP